MISPERHAPDSSPRMLFTDRAGWSESERATFILSAHGNSLAAFGLFFSLSFNTFTQSRSFSQKHKVSCQSHRNECRLKHQAAVTLLLLGGEKAHMHPVVLIMFTVLTHSVFTALTGSNLCLIVLPLFYSREHSCNCIYLIKPNLFSLYTS
ncbi:hypothetical protein ILYODFUR_035669 [Ilyodon furcidens]|uniref:Uncharacterized protein n=1 Tax=Ilyodon furcidens TaxID=33524 RepID=A0ABV0TDU4_9TELE